MLFKGFPDALCGVLGIRSRALFDTDGEYLRSKSQNTRISNAFEL